MTGVPSSIAFLSISRRRNLWILPDGVIGNSSTISTYLGTFQQRGVSFTSLSDFVHGERLSVARIDDSDVQLLHPLEPGLQRLGVVDQRGDRRAGPVLKREDGGHTFILGVCPSTKGEYALPETMPYVRIIGITMDFGLLLLFIAINRKLNQFQPQ